MTELAVLVLLVACVCDFFVGSFLMHRAMLHPIVSLILVVLVSASVIEVNLD